MADANRCPSCGAEQPANAPVGLCPRCLMQQAMTGDMLGPADDATVERAPADHDATLARATGTFAPPDPDATTARESTETLARPDPDATTAAAPVVPTPRAERVSTGEG